MRWKLDYGETHLSISSDRDCHDAALEELIRQYGLLVAHINRNPIFKASYEPVDVGVDAPEIARLMADAAKACNVGPMAAVAGAFADVVGRRIVAEGGRDVIVENGGDIFLSLSKPKTVGVYAGPSPLSGRFALRVLPKDTPCGICTSSGTVGPSISLGNSDSTTVVADCASLADAAASAVGNLIRGPGDIGHALEAVSDVAGVRGVVAIKDDVFGAWGKLPEILKK